MPKWLFIFCAGLLYWAGLQPASGQSASPTYLDELLSRATAQKLHEERYWHILLHYKQGLRRTISRIDDPSFFLAQDGKTNPGAELTATLNAFFEPVEEDGSLDHAICRFTARFAWLVDELEIDTARLPLEDCPDYRQVMDYLKPTSATLVYPAAHINGPASMFGHTLLVIDSEKKDRVLSKAINYAARPTTRFGPLFAVYGIMGLYPGYFAILPYYEKIEQYSDIGHRDIWEYELDLDPAQLDRLVRHAWEMQNHWSDYFFFSENCASELLYFIEAARPEYRLREHMRLHAIPIDTVKLVAQHDLIRDKKYRPSKTSKIHWLADVLGEELSDKVLDTVHGKHSPQQLAACSTNPAQQRAALDLAAEYTQYLYSEEKLPLQTYRKQYLALLKERSKLGKAETTEREPPIPARPEEGHPPGRLQAGIGYMEDEAFYTLELRPAYHELIDREHGYLRGAQIQFLNTEGRYFPDRDEWEIQAVDIIDILSVAPTTAFTKPTSWEFHTGIALQDLVPEDEFYLYRNELGGGKALELGPHMLAYGMFNTTLEFSSRYASSTAWGAGASAGLIAVMGPYQQTLSLKGISFPFGINGERWQADWEQALHLGDRLALRIKYGFIDEKNLPRHEVVAGFYTYF